MCEQRVSSRDALTICCDGKTETKYACNGHREHNHRMWYSWRTCCNCINGSRTGRISNTPLASTLPIPTYLRSICNSIWFGYVSSSSHHQILRYICAEAFYLSSDHIVVTRRSFAQCTSSLCLRMPWVQEFPSLYLPIESFPYHLDCALPAAYFGGRGRLFHIFPALSTLCFLL